jgi:hypothetical protein
MSSAHLSALAIVLPVGFPKQDRFRRLSASTARLDKVILIATQEHHAPTAEQVDFLTFQRH